MRADEFRVLKADGWWLVKTREDTRRRVESMKWKGGGGVILTGSAPLILCGSVVMGKHRRIGRLREERSGGMGLIPKTSLEERGRSRAAVPRSHRARRKRETLKSRHEDR